MKPNKIVTIGLIQSSVSNDLIANLTTTVQKVQKAAGLGAQIVCLSELYRTPYFPRQEAIIASRFAETIPGESTNVFSKLAKSLGVVIIVPLYEKASDGMYYNSAVVIDADGTLFPTYRKMHVPMDRYFYEKNYFAPGNLGFRLFSTKFAKISVFICFDQWYPEAARIGTLLGADILFYPTAIGHIRQHVSSDGDWPDAWETVQRSHAIANAVHVCTVNRTGIEEELQFWGGSFVCDSFGTIVKKASQKEEILVASIDLNKNQQIREGWGFLKNRRPDAYHAICDEN